MLFLASNTLTPMLKRLELLGFVRRERDAADKRSVRILLTGPGRRLMQRARDIPSCILKATDLTHDDAVRMTREISRLRDALVASA